MRVLLITLLKTRALVRSFLSFKCSGDKTSQRCFGDPARQRVSSHSLKVTLLLWLAKEKIDVHARRLLGYHLPRDALSTEIYACQCFAGPLRALFRMLQAIVLGLFNLT